MRKLKYIKACRTQIFAIRNQNNKLQYNQNFKIVSFTLKKVNKEVIVLDFLVCHFCAFKYFSSKIKQQHLYLGKWLIIPERLCDVLDKIQKITVGT